MEALSWKLLPLVVACSSRRGSTSACLRLVSSTLLRLCWSPVGGCFAAPLFASGFFAAVLLWRMLYRHHRWLESTLCGCLAAVVGWSGWMLCHLTCVVDLYIFGGVVSFSRFRGVVLTKFVGSGVSALLLFLLFLFVVMVVPHLLGSSLCSP